MQPALESAVHRLPPEEPASSSRGPRSLFSLLSGIRFDEVLILQGPPLLGAAFSIGRLTSASVADVAVFALGSVCLTAHVFALNDWSGIRGDSRDNNRTNGKAISHERTRNLWIGLLALSFLLLGLAGFRPLIL